MGLQVGSDEPAGLFGRSCCTANRAEEGNAATGMRREERLDRNLELEGSAEMTLLIVMFQSRRREEEWKRRVVHSRRWVSGSMGPPGRVGWACRSRRNLKGQRVASDGPAALLRVASELEGPTGRVGGARGLHLCE